MLDVALELQRQLSGRPARESDGFDPLVQVGDEQRLGLAAFAAHLREQGVTTVRTVSALPGQLGDAGDGPLWDRVLATATPSGPAASWHAVDGPPRPSGREPGDYTPDLWLPGPPRPLPPVDVPALEAAVVVLQARLLELFAALEGRHAARLVREALADLADAHVADRLVHQRPGGREVSAALGVVDGLLGQVLLHDPADVLGVPPTVRHDLWGPRPFDPGGPLERVHRAALPVLQLAAALVEHVADGGPAPRPALPPSPDLPPPPVVPAPLSDGAPTDVRAPAAALDEALALVQDRLEQVPVPRRLLTRRPLDPDLATVVRVLREQLSLARGVLAGTTPAPWWAVQSAGEPEGGSTASRLSAAAQLVQDLEEGSSRVPGQPHVAIADLTRMLGPAWPALLTAAGKIHPATERPFRLYALPKTPTWWQRHR